MRQTALVRALSLLLVALLVPSAVAADDVPSAETAATPAAAPLLEWEVVSRRPHDESAFTQGLLLDDDGRMFESTGLYGGSSLREVDPLSGEVLRRVAVPDDSFAEGLALVEDDLIQLTWRAGLARRYSRDGLMLIGSHAYDGEGWGLCHDGERLVMSDGSDTLTFRDPMTFARLGSVTVTVLGESLAALNELECVEGAVWANVWQTDAIVRIDPADGRVTGVLDLAGIVEPDPAASDPSAVLNGIAHDAEAGTFLVTGKRWPELVEIRILE